MSKDHDSVSLKKFYKNSLRILACAENSSLERVDQMHNHLKQIFDPDLNSGNKELAVKKLCEVSLAYKCIKEYR